MVKDSIKTYKIFIIIFLVTAAVLLNLNFTLMKNIKNKNIVSKNINYVVSDNVEKYGYSYILNLVLQNRNVSISNISSASEDRNLVELELSCKETDNLSSMYEYIEEIKKEKCFLGIENIKINKDKEKYKNISFTTLFKKNK